MAPTPLYMKVLFVETEQVARFDPSLQHSILVIGHCRRVETKRCLSSGTLNYPILPTRYIQLFLSSSEYQILYDHSSLSGLTSATDR